MSDDRPINVHEMRAMVVYVQQAVEAGSDAERDTALGEGIVAWGEQFMVVLGHAARENASWGEPLRDRAGDLFSAWMGGRRLTRRADEEERRALAAIDMARRNPALARLAVEALGQLPEQHPTRRALLAQAVALMDNQASTTDPDQRLSILATKLDRATSPEQKDRLLQEGQALLPRSADATTQRMFRLSAAGVLIERCIGARDRGDAVAQADLAAQARDLLAPILDEDATDGYPRVMEGLLLELEENPALAVQAFLRALDGDLSDDRRLIALAGVLRTGHLSDRNDERCAGQGPGAALVGVGGDQQRPTAVPDDGPTRPLRRPDPAAGGATVDRRARVGRRDSLTHGARGQAGRVGVRGEPVAGGSPARSVTAVDAPVGTGPSRGLRAAAPGRGNRGRRHRRLGHGGDAAPTAGDQTDCPIRTGRSFHGPPTAGRRRGGPSPGHLGRRSRRRGASRLGLCPGSAVGVPGHAAG